MLEDRLSQRLRDVEARFDELERMLASPEVSRDPAALRTLGKEHSDLRPIVEMFARYRESEADLV